MNVVVCLHAPPATAEGRALGRDDTHALGHALALARDGAPGDGSSTVTALLAGTERETGPLHRALSAGASRAVRLGGDDFSAADFHTVGQVLAVAIRRLDADLVLTGARSDDEGLGAVPAATARYLGIGYVGGVEEIAWAGPGSVEVVVRGGGRKRRLRVKIPVVLSVVAGPPGGGIAPPDRTGNPADVDLLSLADPEATVVRRRTELVGREEPASRGTEEVTSAAALVAALARR
jgi:electron transfer flavoprotein alpha/beta subunit